ncbi:ANTAR domain-containing protein [Geodermatophilus sp. YIM 151500]|uniref:ANTAR domain-containing protein n=1 Tax=Geodermatophilus sp. YIM 151500 TaxID=2984531 RepID=UPI0021E38C7A|nr:ANTAR domain-containing protein [Geodermatophilus sp. YIM 151500]MCV2488661.1 ANTAR domain-containing protein [Geodermatophilus sp. YIM 151500]
MEPVADLVEGLSLADLVAEQYGVAADPDRGARRSARGAAGTADTEDAEPVDARVAALERTVAQLEHALAARVAIERAIGVLAERHRTNPRDAFEALRGRARSEGRAVHDLAREVLEGLDDRAVVEAAARAVLGGCPSAAARGATDPAPRRAERSAQLPAGADGRS